MYTRGAEAQPTAGRRKEGRVEKPDGETHTNAERL
jgi:hypothetical protein